MNSPRESQLKNFTWFPDATVKTSKPGMGPALGKLTVGMAFALCLYLSHRNVFAVIVLILTCTLFILTFVAPGIQSSIDTMLLRFGRAVGSLVGGLLLAFTYVFIFTPMRIVRQLCGADDLHLRDGAKLSYWLPCDTDRRKARYIGTMFTTEVHVRRGNSLLVLAGTLVALLLLAEGVLRLEGYSTVVNYVADPIIGYYTEPNVNLKHFGNRIVTNKFGMRSHDFEINKPKGVFRILLLGDSTLFGGSYIDQSDLYSTRLEEQLNRRFPDRKIEVLAMGVNGWGPFHERGFISRFGTFNADLVIVNLPLDDINRPLYGLMSAPFFAVQTPPQFALEQLMNHYIWDYRKLHSGLDAKWEDVQSQLGIQEYGKLADDLHSRGHEVMVACLPGRDPGFGTLEPPRELTWREQLTHTLAEHGIQMYFPLGLFIGKGTPNEIYHDEWHLLPKGHHLYADYLETRVVADSKRLHRFLSEVTR